MAYEFLEGDFDKTLYSTKKIFFRFWNLISKKRRRDLNFLLFIALLSGIAEIFTLASVIPLLTILASPERLYKIPLFNKLLELLPFESSNQITTFIVTIFIISVLLSGSIRLLNFKLNFRISALIGSDIASYVYKTILYQPYKYHLEENSSKSIQAVTERVTNCVSVINSFLNLISSLIISIFIFLILIIFDWRIAITIVFSIGIAYFLIVKLIKPIVESNGLKVVKFERIRLKIIQESLGGIKDILLDNSQFLHVDDFKSKDRNARVLIGNNQFLNISPKYIIESIGLIIIALIALSLSTSSQNAQNLIPILGVFVLGAQKMLPSLQYIFSNLIHIRSQAGSVNVVFSVLDKGIDNSFKKLSKVKFRFKNSIQIKNLSFKYNSNEQYILNNINLEIKRGERIGLIGETGSGKSTLIDILMGLLSPSSGQLLIDGNDIYAENSKDILSEWRSIIAHVPQTIYLKDTSYLKNIAFNIPLKKIDYGLVKESANKALISHFIESKKQNFEGIVGERGINISGGQRQRIGLARALYKKTDILILDEATSALDLETERRIMKSIESLNKEITIILISHRLSTLENCDRIITIGSGKIINECKPEDLIKN